MKRIAVLIGFVAFFFNVILCSFAGHSITLAWNANPPEENVAGYVLAYGNQSSNWTMLTNVGNNTQATLQLTYPLNYFFVVAAYNNYGLQGEWSEQVAYATEPTNRPAKTGTITATGL